MLETTGTHSRAAQLREAKGMEGLPIQILRFRDHAGIGVMTWGTLLTVVPNPRQIESLKGSISDRRLRKHAELRASVQRMLKATSKGRNVAPYAAYIAAGMRGDLGESWSTPPLCLWSPTELEVDDAGHTTLPLIASMVAIDAETQLTAMHTIWEDPEDFGLTEEHLAEAKVAFEMYWGIDLAAARQIFHDRNLLGVPVNKNFALSMDTRDFATAVAQHAVAQIEVKTDGALPLPLAHFVNTQKRQLAKNDTAWMTLTGMRTLTVTALLGSVEKTSTHVDLEELPPGVDPDEATEAVTEVLDRLFAEFSDQIAARSAMTTPAVLAGIGLVLHRAMPWMKGNSPLTIDQVMELLRNVHWEREAEYWVGTGARQSPNGRLNWGGAKDSGHHVAQAIVDTKSESGLRIREGEPHSREAVKPRTRKKTVAAR